MALLEVQDLHTYLYTRQGMNRAVNGVSFQLDRGRTLGLVGESGSGKTMTAMSILRLVPRPAAHIVGGKIMFDGEDLLEKSESQMRKVRGAEIAIILQDPLSSLNPVFSVKFQIGEALQLHQGLAGADLSNEIMENLRRVRVPSPQERMRDYPHQFSGGMRQRVVGAIAISCQPKLLIADEPTTALDSTIQAQYLNLLRELQEQLNLALLFITHDFGIVAKMCDDVAVMYAGRIVERATVREMFARPAHPYALALLQAVPKMEVKEDRLFAIEGVPATGHTEFVGCSFAPRCPFAIDKCHVESPPVVVVEPGHESECWRAQEVFEHGATLLPSRAPAVGSASDNEGSSSETDNPEAQEAS